jgi:hypothetical protein
LLVVRNLAAFSVAVIASTAHVEYAAERVLFQIAEFGAHKHLDRFPCNVFAFEYWCRV